MIPTLKEKKRLTPQKCGFAHALNVSLSFRDGVADVFKITESSRCVDKLTFLQNVVAEIGTQRCFGKEINFAAQDVR